MSHSDFDVPRLSAALTELGFQGDIEIHPEISSTNDRVKVLGLAGARHGTLVLAEHQSRGRGRRGAVWHSPPGRNLLCSLLLRPAIPLERWPEWTHIAALSIAEALDPLQIRAEIKWPNDLMVGGRKICGILLETVAGASGCFAVLGFGLNVNMESADFSPEVADLATSLRIELGRPLSRQEVLLAGLRRCVANAAIPFAEVLGRISRRSFLLGRKIVLTHANGEEETGLVEGFGPQGALLFKGADGETREILTSEKIRRL